jgi:hypothetical protein
MDTVTLSGVVMKGTSSITGMGARPWAKALAQKTAVPAAVQMRAVNARQAASHATGLTARCGRRV